MKSYYTFEKQRLLWELQTYMKVATIKGNDFGKYFSYEDYEQFKQYIFLNQLKPQDWPMQQVELLMAAIAELDIELSK